MENLRPIAFKAASEDKYTNIEEIQNWRFSNAYTKRFVSDRWLLKLDAQSKSFELLRDRTLGIEEKPSEMIELQQIEANPTEIKTPRTKYEAKTDWTGQLCSKSSHYT